MSMSRFVRVPLSTLLPLGAAVLCPAQAPAQTGASASPVVLEEIVVTATKRSQRLQDVPVAVSAVTAQDIQSRGFSQYADYLNTLPGVYFTDGGPGISQIRIRGLTAAEGGIASTVATYFGETVTSVLTNHGGKPNLRLVDIDRVELLRGPQGTLFGANALAGVLRVIPAAPDPSGFDASVGVRSFHTAHSSDQSYHVEGMVNVPLVADRLALRLVGYRDDTAGFIDNVFPGQPEIDYTAIGELIFGLPEGSLPPGTLRIPQIDAFSRRDINSEDTWGARASLRWQAADNLLVDLTYAAQDVTLNSEPFVLPAAGRYAQSRGIDVYEEGRAVESLDIATLTINYEHDAFSFTSASSLTRMKRLSDDDIAFLAEASFGVPIPWTLQDRSWGKLFTQEVRLQSNTESPLQWLIGAFYLNQESDASQYVPDYSCPTCLPTVAMGDDFAMDFPRATFAKQEQYSVFGELNYTFAGRWTAGVGARYLEEDITSIDPAATGLLAGGVLEARSSKGSISELNPSAYLRFAASQDVTMYLQAGRGFRSGQVNQQLPDTCKAQADALGAQSITDPDTLWNYELGVKSRFAGGRVGLNAAAFRHKWEGVQQGVVLDCGFGVLLNAGDVTGEGVEIELDARPAPAWRLNLALSYVRNEFDKVKPATGFVPGERLPEAPEKNASFGVQYDFRLGDNWQAFARADYTYVGDVLMKFADSTVTLDSFGVTNLRLSFQRDSLAFDLYGRNVTDEWAVLTLLSPQQGSRQTVLRPREIGVELRYYFD